MIQQLKFPKPTYEANAHFVSCMHIGHNREFIYGPRGFKNVEDHDRELFRVWNARVNPNDNVFSIGDTVFGMDAEKPLRRMIETLNYKTLYISPGNHFSGWKQLYKHAMSQYQVSSINENDAQGVEIYPLIYRPWGTSSEKKVVFMPNLYEAYFGHQAAVLCHYSIYPHHGASKGVWGIFGHCHANNPATNKNTGTGKVLDVCVESFGGPVSYQEVEAIFRTRKSEDVSHHTADTKCAI